jgi:hypothetical protein
MTLVSETAQFPKIQALAWKHGFGSNESGGELYMTMTVRGIRGNFGAALFGTEHTQVEETSTDMRDACRRIEHRFRTLFPDHACGRGCNTTWQPFPLTAEPKPQTIQ